MVICDGLGLLNRYSDLDIPGKSEGSHAKAKGGILDCSIECGSLILGMIMMLS